MANEIVKYSNQFNAQALRKFTGTDLDLLMAIASRVRDKGADTVTFDFSELRSLAGLRKNLTNQELADCIIEVNRRLLALNFELHDEDTTIQFALFQTFKTSVKSATLEVSVHPTFRFLLNDLTSQFTRFELRQFTGLKSSYAKETYRRLKQYRSTGVWRVSVSEFRRLLDVPASYRVSHLEQRVLRPIEEELGPLMHLEIERVYRKTGAGRGRRRLTALVFRFDKEAAKAPAVSSRPAKGDLGLIHTKYGQQYQGEWDDAELLAHLHGSVDQGECPVCAAWESNRARHGCMGA
ncbi:replication initiation protein [Pseudoscardovia radai]|uniref:replication initiation protein n=1 Tax=Pseudoscardovia radai TaxID=987066 RepID=UPI003992C3F9